jgi:methylmalonyl-CoA mutase
LRGEPGPWKALSRLDHPGADDFNAQAREDLDNGAEGLTVVFKGSGAAYGFGLARADAAGLDRAFEAVAFDSGLHFSLELAEAAQADSFAALVERLAEPSVAHISFGLDPLGAGLKRQVAALAARGFKGPFVAADARIVHDAGGTPAQELAYALSAGVAALRALEDAGAIEFRLAADADQFATIAKFRALRLLWGRAGLAAFAAGLGGADSVTLLPFSQALGLPDAFARRLARNTQLVELREARLGFVADPAAGAGGFEALTTGLCEKAWALFQAQEAAGGLAAALQSGLIQKAVAASAAALQRDVARAKAPLTGLSTHPSLNADAPAVLPDVPAPKPPLTPGALRPLRLAAPFEQLRERAKAKAPRMFLAAIGPLAAHTRRVGFARDFFEAGGVATLAGAGADDAAAIAEGFRSSGAALACLCGTDEAYAAQAESFAAALKAAGATAVYLAGRPGEHEAAWRAAGVDGFIFLGADLVASLDEVLRRAGA